MVCASIMYNRLIPFEFNKKCKSKLEFNVYFFFKFQAVAMDTAAFGITCNALCPAWTDTPRKLGFFFNYCNMLVVLSFFLFGENEKIKLNIILILPL